MIWAWVLSGEWSFGIAIGGLEMLTKIVLYYLHDRIWHRTESSHRWDSHKTLLFKTITWRFLGTIDTIVLSWLVSESWHMGLQLVGIEFITKMALYFVHERIWFRIKWKTSAESANA
jgi:uncharacterized membrane protein